MSIPSLHICILRCIHVLKWYQDTPRVLTLMRHCTSLCRMLVCTAQPPLSRITSCDGPHHARNSQWSLIKRQHQDSPRVPPYLHTYHHYLDVLVHFSAFVEALRRFKTPTQTPPRTCRCVIHYIIILYTLHKITWKIRKCYNFTCFKTKFYEILLS